MTAKRVENIKRNLVFEIGAKTGSFLLAFLSRAIFIRYLGEDYLGINGYYSNILQILNLSELGLANAAMFHLYKPLAENDTEHLKSLEAYYRKLYRAIALFILVVGLLLTPWIEQLVRVQKEIPNLKLYYVLALLNIVASYLFIYKNTLLNASQNQYIYNTSSVVFSFLMQIVQIGVLTIRRDYALYLIVQAATTAANMVYISCKADKLFPFLKDKKVKELDREEKKSISCDVRAMCPYKIGEGILNYSDNIFINSLINTTTIAFYTNYVSLTNVLTLMGSVVYNAIFATIGDFNVSSDEKQKKQLFNMIIFGYSWIAMFFACGFICMASDIVKIWLGERFMLPSDVVLAMSLNVYLVLIMCPVNVYRITTGMFRKTKGILLYAAAANIFFSYFLGSRFGLIGIVLATSLARLITQFWFEPVVLYREVFSHSHVNEYFRRVTMGIIIALLSSVIVDRLAGILPFRGIIYVVIKLLICCLIPNLLYYLIYKNDPSMIITEDLISRKFAKFMWKRK